MTDPLVAALNEAVAQSLESMANAFTRVESPFVRTVDVVRILREGAHGVRTEGLQTASERQQEIDAAPFGHRQHFRNDMGGSDGVGLSD